MTTGVILVTYCAEDVIVDCLESLLASQGVDLRIVVVDNASPDQTVRTVTEWAAGRIGLQGVPWQRPYSPLPHGPVSLAEGETACSSLRRGEVGLIQAGTNLGFAGGVNLGLKALRAHPEVDHFWILNPDCMAESTTAMRLEQRAAQAGDFGVIGGRVYYTVPQGTIQSDGGRINFWTGICTPFNMTCRAEACTPPKEVDLDYISGAHMFVSRRFLDQVGLMPEDYFLYYEEMDWCCRGKDLGLLFEPEAAVHHHGGHSIGSATMTKGPSPLAAYFLNRSRIRFMVRFRPVAIPLALAYSTARALRQLLRGQVRAGTYALRGLWGFPPGQEILARIGRDRLP